MRSRIGFSWNGLPQYAARLLRSAVAALNEPCVVIGSPPTVPVQGMEEALGQNIIWVDANKSASWSDIGIAPPELFFQSGWSYRAFSDLGKEVKANGGYVIGLSDANWRADFRQLVLGTLGYRILHRSHFDAMLVPGANGTRLMRYFGVPPTRVASGMYGADPALFPPGPALETRPLAFQFVGQFIERKNVLPLARAFIRFAEIKTNWILRLCGSGPQHSLLPSHPRIHVEQFVQPAQLHSRLSAARFLVLPSRSEAWGLVVHEATLTGCAVILSDAVGSAADLTTSRNCVLFPADDEDALMRAMLEAADRSNAWLSEARLESLRLSSNFGPTRFASEVVNFVRQLAPQASQ